MEFEEFSKTISHAAPPDQLNKYALALWYDAKGDWEQAHTIIQDLSDKNAAWIHAYLHRKEGDTANAGYWYSRAAKPRADYSLEKEWETIVKAVLKA